VEIKQFILISNRLDGEGGKDGGVTEENQAQTEEEIQSSRSEALNRKNQFNYQPKNALT